MDNKTQPPELTPEEFPTLIESFDDYFSWEKEKDDLTEKEDPCQTVEELASQAFNSF